MINRETIIRSYIDGYNQFDIDKMVADFHEDIIFENSLNGEVNLSLKGLEAFKKQAQLAKDYFSERRQTVISITHKKEESEVEIAYTATLSTDAPNGLKKGDKLQLQGKSIFTFLGNKIIKLTDIS
jgi:hypothetical protein